MPAVERKFKTNDKVFAKVRGYPPWPARIEGLADETPNRLKYHIFFYGTRETGVCRQDELFPYVEFKEKYGKGVKRKFFTEALQEIECDFGTPESRITVPAPRSDTSETQATSDNEGSLVIDESLEKKTKPKSKISTPQASEAMDVDSLSYHKASPVVKVTTSGRKIKPKKTFDPDDNDSFSRQSGSFKEDTFLPGQTDASLIKASVCRVKTMDGKLVILDINKFTAPEHCKTEKSINLWRMNKMNEFQQVKEKIEEGETVSDEYNKIIEEQCQSEVQAELIANEKTIKTQLKLEVTMLDIDLRIKDAIGIDHADCDECLQALDELSVLPLTPLMLKKHPEIVDTCRRLQRYTGNTAEWNMTEEEVEAFSIKAAEVRAKADFVYNIIKKLFSVPASETFWETFMKELDAFNDITKNMPAYDLFSLCIDPSPKTDQ